MKKIIITRGLPGAGKSSFIKNMGLEDWALSMDDLRMVYRPPAYNHIHGHFEVDQSQNDRVYALTMQLLEERMREGHFIIYDATNIYGEDSKKLLRFINEYDYDPLWADFSDVPLDVVKTRNKQRPASRYVSERTIERMYNTLQSVSTKNIDDKRVLSLDPEFDNKIQDFMSVPYFDASKWKDICFIGDIQGCADPLFGKNGLLENGLEDNRLYVFVGDFLDRGPQNGEVLEWAIKKLTHRENVLLIRGNHDQHLENWAKGREVKIKEFHERTLPQLHRSGIKRDDVIPFIQKFQDFAVVQDQYGRKILVSHPGFAGPFDMPALIPSRRWQRGYEGYNFDIDAKFDTEAPEGWYQVHGHRNKLNIGINDYDRSFNLEDRVEFGGYLRAVIADKDGFNTIMIKNDNVVDRAKLVTTEPALKEAWAPEWISSIDGKPVIPDDRLKELQDHNLIMQKNMLDNPYIISHNFTREAFYDRNWDSVNSKARGFFTHALSHEILARSYDKFFNVNEFDHVKEDVLMENMKFPVTSWLKENGYLGILGWDSDSDDFLFASKSSTTSDFAGWFRDIFNKTVNETQREVIKTMIRDYQGSCIFEVNDPVNDPHIIPYDKPHIVLLDVVRRHEDFERLDMKKLGLFSEASGLEIKQRATTLKTPELLQKYINYNNKRNATFKNKPVEGFVLEDAAGFQVKIKQGHYQWLKHMRNQHERMRRAIDKNQDIPALPQYENAQVAAKHPWLKHDPESGIRDSRAFYTWLTQQERPVLDRDIISLHQGWQSGVKQLEMTDSEKERIDDKSSAKRPDPNIIGFQRGIDTLVKAIDEGKNVKVQSIQKVFDRCELDPSLEEFIGSYQDGEILKKLNNYVSAHKKDIDPACR